MAILVSTAQHGPLLHSHQHIPTIRVNANQPDVMDLIKFSELLITAIDAHHAHQDIDQILT